MSNPETSPVAPPSIALALMAWALAVDRTHILPAFKKPRERVYASEPWSPASAEYYRIIDRISRGEQP